MKIRLENSTQGRLPDWDKIISENSTLEYLIIAQYLWNKRTERVFFKKKTHMAIIVLLLSSLRLENSLKLGILKLFVEQFTNHKPENTLPRICKNTILEFISFHWDRLLLIYVIFIIKMHQCVSQSIYLSARIELKFFVAQLSFVFDSTYFDLS